MDQNNTGIEGIINNSLSNSILYRKDLYQIDYFMRSSDFLGFKYLIEEKIGKENSVVILEEMVPITNIRNIDILEYIMDLGINVNMHKLALNSFINGRFELFWYIKDNYDLFIPEIFDLIHDQFMYVMYGEEVSDEEIDRTADFLDIFNIDLKMETPDNKYNVLETLLMYFANPTPKFIRLIVKQKAGFLLSGNRQNIKNLINRKYPSYRWLRRINY